MGRTPYNKGKPKPEIEKLKLSQSKTGKPNGHLGLKRSEQAKANMSKSHLSIDRTSEEYKQKQKLRNIKRGKSGSIKWQILLNRPVVKQIESMMKDHNFNCKELDICFNWKRQNDEKILVTLSKVQDAV